MKTPHITTIHSLDSICVPGTTVLFNTILIDGINILIKEINPKSAEVTIDSLKTFFDQGGVIAYAFDENKVILGMATLIRSVKVTDTTLRIEHVSVLPRCRRMGIGHKLMKTLCTVALKLQPDLRYIDLTCKSDNVGGNQFYRSLGFKLRNTSSLRFSLK